DSARGYTGRERTPGPFAVIYPGRYGHMNAIGGHGPCWCGIRAGQGPATASGWASEVRAAIPDPTATKAAAASGAVNVHFISRSVCASQRNRRGISPKFSGGGGVPEPAGN